VGIADYSIVFANVDGEKFTAFIIDQDTEGLSSGLEEKKMGIKGSSTRMIIMENVKVPVENVLFQVGLGHVVAFNILNLGRMKIAAGSIGIAKFAMELSATYANERQQFKTPIAQFGLIKEKLAEMATKIYVAESMLYRTGGLLDDSLRNVHATGDNEGQIVAKCIEEYALECSLNKVFATEILAYCVDEGVQIHGGYGFSAEYDIERLYRDARVTRLFEGTSEINRTIIPTTLMRKADKDNLPVQETLEKLRQRISTKAIVRNNEADLVQAAKDIFLYVLDAGLKKYGKGLMRNQEIVGRLADLAIEAFAMESAWLRAQKAAIKLGENDAKHKLNMATMYIYTNISSLVSMATEILAELAADAELENALAELQILSKFTPRDTIGLRREIAATVSNAGKYVS
jgi:alkylation response protein AidB-like acyl-CoA dehydrogenase